MKECYENINILLCPAKKDIKYLNPMEKNFILASVITYSEESLLVTKL